MITAKQLAELCIKLEEYGPIDWVDYDGDKLAAFADVSAQVLPTFSKIENNTERELALISSLVRVLTENALINKK